MINTKKLIQCLIIFCLSSATFASHAYEREYRVTITNLTKGMLFTPFLGATHKNNIKLFRLGQQASDNVTAIAEGGDISGLQAELASSNSVSSTASSGGLLAPGESVAITINSERGFGRLSLIAMLLPTNDTLVALRGAKLPRHGSAKYYMQAYDGGSETNDELCAHIPGGGPCGGGEALSPDDAGEGYVYFSPTIHGEGDLSRADHLWDGNVARVIIRRIR